MSRIPLTRWLRRFAAAAVVVLAAGPAFAHAVLVQSSLGDKPLPANTATTVTMRFNAALEQSFFQAILVGPGKERLTLKTAPGRDSTEELVTLPPLKPGKYAITYKVLAADSHLTEAILRFMVAAP